MTSAKSEMPIRLLLVEDDPSFATGLGLLLNEIFSPPLALKHVSRLDEALEYLAGEPVDVVLLDLTLPDRRGIATYKDAQAAAPMVAVVVLTGLDDQQLALQAVREGAQDFLVKTEIDGRMLSRIIRYAIERKRAAEALRESEQFFRLISENVTDLIAVLDCDGRRLYNNPSYTKLLGDPARLEGSDSFGEIYPDDRSAVKRLFEKTLETGQGQRCTYRMLLPDGKVRDIESQGSVITDVSGRPSKVVVVSRDVTEHKEAVQILQTALADVKKSHEELQATQVQLIQAEKLEAISTFAAGVAHEVKNPLQTVILGVDYLSNHYENDPTTDMILSDMGNAVQRADAIIKGLLEFSAYRKREVRDENLSQIIELALRSLESELSSSPICVEKDLGIHLPLLRLDLRTMKHVFINLFIYCLRAMSVTGGTLRIRTYATELKENYQINGRPSAYFKAGETIVIGEVGFTATATPSEQKLPITPVSDAKAGKNDPNLGLTVLKKIIELYGGVIQVASHSLGNNYTIAFKAVSPPKTL